MSDRMTDSWGFAPPVRRTAPDDLVALWRSAMEAAVHPPTCLCQGLTPSYPAPDVVEGNMLDFLRAQYREAGQEELVAFISQRRNKKPFAGLRPSFEAWLQAIPSAPIDPASRTVLAADMAATLRSYAETAAFECT